MTAVQRPPLTRRRQATFDGLLDSARRLLDEDGYDGLTVRAVALAAGVTHTTAYSFVPSKAQLVAELYLREMERLDPLVLSPSASPADRAAEAIEGPALLFSGEPAVGHAVQVALMMGDGDPALMQLRERVAAITLGRLRQALPGVDAEVIGVIFAAYNGAMVTVGMGHGTHADIVRTVRRLVELIGLS